MANPLKEPDGTFTTTQGAEVLASGKWIDSLMGDEPEQDEPDANTLKVEAPQEAETTDEVETGDEESDTETEPEESIALETIDDVAAALGVDANQLLDNLKLRIKVNGEEQLITLSEAQKGNQFEQDYRHKTSALAEERRSLESERQSQFQQFQHAVTETAAALQFSEWMLSQEINSPYMAELRNTNPAEWVARNQEHQQKLMGLQQARAQATQHYTQMQQQQQAAHQQRLAAMLQDQDARLRSKVSDWTPEKQSGVAKFLQDRYGYNDSELSGVYDHRLILMALDAQRGAQATQDAAKVIKKVTSLPKLQKPGKQTTPITVKAKQIAGLRSSLRKSGNMRDAARVIEAMNLV